MTATRSFLAQQVLLNSVQCTQFSTGVLGAKIHKTLRKHTSEKYMSVCLMAESVQQKKRLTAPKNLKTYIYFFGPHRGKPHHGYCSSSQLSYLATATAAETAM